MKAKSIKDLVNFALADNANKHAEYVFSKMPKHQASEIEKAINVNLTGCERLIDTSGIRHTIRKHGDSKKEAKRGQIAVTIDDFELIKDVVRSPDSISYGGKNSLKQDVFIYSKKIGSLYIVAEAVRYNKRGNKLIFNSMYKKK